tara:strand:- start:1069 stop:2457 length:1389 start_codon:yes stop_codon:yes gene_type:complete
MALNTPGYSLTPAPSQVALSSNYITNFDFLNQYLPDTYEKEFERYGNRSVSSFLRMVGAEMPSNSDLIKWAEQGRLHIKYTAVTSSDAGGGDTATLTVADAGVSAAAVRAGQTIMISDNLTGSTLTNKAIVTAVTGLTINVAFYEAAGQAAYTGAVTIFIYGSEFAKGTLGMVDSLEAEDEIFSNKPIIIKDKYAVSGSDMAQIGWVEVTTENGANGYLWYLKSEHETRLRFEDYLETAMVESVPMDNTTNATLAAGSEGLFYVLEDRGNVWSGGNPTTLDDFDSIVTRLDKQGSIEENVLFLDREFSFDIDDMLATLSGFTGGTGTAANSASFGLFDNDRDMALNLGFSGFRRGYDFYKSDWKYLNDITMRGGLVGGSVSGVLVPAGSTTVYDQVLGKNAKRPFLHVRYRASQTEDRRMKTWITGSAGGASNSDLDAMEVHFLSERALCTLGANNFVLFKD